ncbi:hypothetical protein ACIGBH_41680 [Streptomyces sp. NPDC085929]|uniref:hypothetical protein n=1 Tax=Streptomyces sp. NPDC085929 TaxID=3365739 RepID=UPI0037CD09C7
MAPAKNEVLAAWMDQHGLSAGALAELVNDAMTDITGRRGTTGERHAFRWLSGESAWPQHRYRRALEAVTGLAAPDLGFVPRRAARPARAQDHPEEPVLRRTFLTATTGTTVSLTPLAATRPAVGTADVARLRSGLDTLLALDDARGGHAALERAALAGAREVLALQERSATQRVRAKLFSIAANYTATAAWSCIDTRQHTAAQAHLERALQLAGLARDSETAMRVWNFTAMVAHQRRDYTASPPGRPHRPPESPAATPSTPRSPTPAPPSGTPTAASVSPHCAPSDTPPNP